MIIKWFPPLDKLFGRVSELALDGPTELREVLIGLRNEKPEFAPYANFGPEDVQPYGLLVWRGGQVLTLRDVVNPDDEVEMIVMIAGG